MKKLKKDSSAGTEVESSTKAQDSGVCQPIAKPLVMRRFMQDECTGWVIICINHPIAGTDYIVPDTFSYRKKDAIKRFFAGSDGDWNYWKKKFNFRAVRAKRNVSVVNGA